MFKHLLFIILITPIVCARAEAPSPSVINTKTAIIDEYQQCMYSLTFALSLAHQGEVFKFPNEKTTFTEGDKVTAEGYIYSPVSDEGAPVFVFVDNEACLLSLEKSKKTRTYQDERQEVSYCFNATVLGNSAASISGCLDILSFARSDGEPSRSLKWKNNSSGTKYPTLPKCASAKDEAMATLKTDTLALLHNAKNLDFETIKHHFRAARATFQPKETQNALRDALAVCSVIPDDDIQAADREALEHVMQTFESKPKANSETGDAGSD